MNSFAQKFPAFTALLMLVAAEAKDLAAPGETVMQKLEGEIAIAPQAIAFLPQVSALSSEFALLKDSPADIEAGGEMLVTDLAFSSDKAKAVIAAAFPVAEQAVALVSPLEALIAAIKA